MDFEFTPLNDDELAKITGGVSESLRQRVNAKFDETWAIITQAYSYKDLVRPEIKYDLQGHTGGWAIGSHTIRLNSAILNDSRYTEDMINQTLPHEIAHIAVHQLFPNVQAHGRVWRNMMRLIGLRPDRCHQYETVAVRKTKKYQVYCDCNTPHLIGITRMRRMMQGTSRYYCRRCGTNLRLEE